ncbi:hypothetical protein ACV07N_04440 [Roseivirga echinicomitans]
MNRLTVFFLFVTHLGICQKQILIESNGKSELLLSSIAIESEFIELKYPKGMQPQIVSKVLEVDNYLFVYDSDSPIDQFPRRVAQFNKNGEFQKLVDYNSQITYDDLNKVIYSARGGDIDVFNESGTKLNEINLKFLDNISPEDQGFHSFAFFKKKIYYMQYAFTVKENKVRLLLKLKSYDLEKKNTTVIYDEVVENSTTAFPSINTINNGQLIHHNPNLDKIFVIDQQSNIVDELIVTYNRFKPNNRIKSRYSYFLKSEYLFGYYQMNTQYYNFIYNLNNQNLYSFKTVIDEGTLSAGVKDDIYKTGFLRPLNFNVVNKAYSIRYKHPDGTYGTFLANSNPSILIFKLK